MAARIPLFFSSDYSPEEMAVGDSLGPIGKIVLVGIGDPPISIDGGGGMAVDFGPPLDPGDLTNKAYVDAVASGLDPHESVHAKTAAALPLGAYSFLDLAGLGTLANLDTVIRAKNGGVAGDSITVNIVTTGGSGSGVVVNEGAYPAIVITCETGVSDRAAFETAINASTYLYVKQAGVATGAITGTLSATNLDDGANGWMATGTGVGHALESTAKSATDNVIDGYTCILNDRVLISFQGGDDVTPDVNNGVYYLAVVGTAGAKAKFVRATDLDATGELNQGVYVFVTDGTTYGNTGWTETTADPITVDTTPNKWSQFSGAPQMTYDQGLKRIVSSIQVDLDNGADAQGQGAPTAVRKSGLEFDADDASGQLRVAVAPNGGIQRFQTSPYGLEIKLKDSTLALDGSGGGLSVLGVPASWTIGGATVTGVDAADLIDLTDGGETNLHSHAATPATEAPVIETDWVAGPAGVNAFYPVHTTAVNNEVLNGNTDTDANCAVIGVAMTSEPSDDPVQVESYGLVLGALSGLGFVAGDRIYLKTGGGLLNAAPAGGQRVVEMGFAKNASDLFLRIIDRGRKAV